MNDNSNIDERIKGFNKEYLKFMNISGLPNYNIKYKEITLEKAINKGFDAPASADYYPERDEHLLTIAKNLDIKPYLIFHEFTHILDSDMLAKNDKIAYAAISGFTEYHASQVELMKLLGANRINDKISFSMDSKIETYAKEETVRDYLHGKIKASKGIFIREDFPADVESLKVGFALLFNYWGLRSICEMYAIDYIPEENYSCYYEYLSKQGLDILNQTMHGWINNKQLDIIKKLYLNIVFGLIKKYDLK